MKSRSWSLSAWRLWRNWKKNCCFPLAASITQRDTRNINHAVCRKTRSPLPVDKTTHREFVGRSPTGRRSGGGEKKRKERIISLLGRSLTAGVVVFVTTATKTTMMTMTRRRNRTTRWTPWGCRHVESTCCYCVIAGEARPSSHDVCAQTTETQGISRESYQDTRPRCAQVARAHK